MLCPSVRCYRRSQEWVAPLLRESGSSPEHSISLIRQRDVVWKASIENSRFEQSDHSWRWDPLRLVAGLYQSVRFHNTSPTFCQRDGIGRRVRLRSGCLYGVEGSSPSTGISYDCILQRRMTIRLHASFVLLWCWVRTLVFFVIQESSDRGC